MKDDTISRAATIKALNTEIIKRRLLDDVNDGLLDEFDTESILRTLPSAQPERKRGHWIGGDGSYICSECNGNPIDFINTMGASFDAYVETPPNYCPHCGADMRREERDD